MKKLFICFFLILTNYLIAQKSFKGFGFFGSLTQSAHYYKNFDTDKKNNDSAFKYFPEYFYPQSHISKEFFNWGAGCFLELGKDYKLLGNSVKSKAMLDKILSFAKTNAISSQATIELAP